jgi:hypothetical protein
MQAENAVSCCTVPATENGRPVLPLLPLVLVPAPELPAVPLELDPLPVVVDVVVVPRFATRGACEPPHAAATTPRLARVAARRSFLTAPDQTSDP